MAHETGNVLPTRSSVNRCTASSHRTRAWHAIPWTVPAFIIGTEDPGTTTTSERCMHGSGSGNTLGGWAGPTGALSPAVLELAQCTESRLDPPLSALSWRRKRWLWGQNAVRDQLVQYCLLNLCVRSCIGSAALVSGPSQPLLCPVRLCRLAVAQCVMMDSSCFPIPSDLYSRSSLFGFF